MVASVSWPYCLCIHVSIFAWYVFSLSYSHNLTTSPTVTYGGKWKFLTYLNLVLQTVFFGLCVLTDVVNLTFPARFLRGGVQSLLVKLRDNVFTMFAFPYATLVFSSFWSLYAIDRELVQPKEISALIPPWFNHAMHTTIVPLVLVQMYIQNHAYASRLKGVTVVLFCCALYVSWVFWVHHASGIWVYPILAKLSLMSRCFFFGGCAGSTVVLYLLGDWLSARMWANQWASKKRH